MVEVDLQDVGRDLVEGDLNVGLRKKEGRIEKVREKERGRELSGQGKNDQ